MPRGCQLTRRKPKMTMPLATPIFLFLLSVVLATPLSAAPASQSAVFIGIDQYVSHRPLSGSVADCTALAETLKSKFGFSRVIELYNERATRGEIIRTLRDLTGRLREEDDLLIVYNGRG